MNIKKEINSLRNEMRTYKLIITKKEDIVKGKEEDLIKEKMTITPVKIYNDLGKKKLNFRNEHQVISNKAANFLFSLLVDEKEKFKRKGNIKEKSEKIVENHSNHLRIRDIHNYYSKRLNLKLLLFTFGFPLIFFFKISKLKSMYRYFFFLPSIFSVVPMLDAVKTYITNKHAFLMLMCIEKYYKDDKDVYDRYKEFMRLNHIDFVKVNK